MARLKDSIAFLAALKTARARNPEELLGAAHASCYALALSAALERAGHTPEKVSADARVHLTPKDGGGFEISKIELSVDATVPEIDEDQFMEMAESAKEGCIISVALAAIPTIELSATLNQ